MSDRCEPPPELRGVDGLACWVSLDGAAMVWTWDATEDGGSWWAQDVTMSVEDATAKGWRYAGRVPFPTELAAAKEREAMLVGALQTIVDADRSKFSAEQHMMEFVEIAERALGIPHWGTPEREAYEKERQS